MTLSTDVRICDDTDYQMVFLKCRELIGIPAEHPFSVTKHERSEYIMSRPGGFAAMLVLTHNYGQLLAVDECDEDCDEPCTYHGPLRAIPAYVNVDFDTAYGQDVKTGESCVEIHRRLTAELGAWLDKQGINWWANDEFTGEWHERTPCPVTS